MAGELIYLSPAQLRLHPRNMRLYYPDEDAAEMAGSIKAAGGVYQALLICASEEPDIYHVIDGNMRLAGARLLGDDCPPLKCELVEADRAEQMIIMAATSKYHYPKDPVSEAWHYRRLIDDEGFGVSEIADRMGCSTRTIYVRLTLLDLDEDIQRLVAEKRLSPDVKVARALLSLPDPALRLRLARRFAANGTSIAQIQKGCSFALRQMARLNGDEPAPVGRPQKSSNGRQAVEAPAGFFGAIYDIAGKTLCDDCRLDGLGDNCYVCPGPRDFIQHLVEMAETRKEPDDEVVT